MLKFTLVLLRLSLTKGLVGGVAKGPLGLVGDFALIELDDSFRVIPGKLGFEVDAERCWPIWVGELVLAIEPLFMKLEGRSPNFGKAN